MKNFLITLIVISNVALAVPNTQLSPGYFLIENDLPIGALISESSNNIPTGSNPDMNIWSTITNSAYPSTTLLVTVNSQNAYASNQSEFLNPIYKNYLYNSQATLTINITQPGVNGIISTCIVPVAYFQNTDFFDNQIISYHNEIMVVTKDKEDRVECGQSTYYVQDDRFGRNLNYLFVHSGYSNY